MGSDRLAALGPAEAVFVDDFDDESLDRARWVDHYLPHWTTPDRSRARYALTDDGLQLRIEADQLDWRPEDAPLRVSNIQTATFCGPRVDARHPPAPLGRLDRTDRYARAAAVGSAGGTGGRDGDGERRHRLHVRGVAGWHRTGGGPRQW